MSEENGAETTQPKKNMSPIVAAVAAVAGIGVSFVLTPFFTSSPPAAAPAPAAHVEDAGASHGGGGENEGGGGHAPAGGGEGGEFLELGNILVNPKGSQGMRFLMITVALEFEDAKLRDEFRRREAQVRDVVVSELIDWTMEDLTGVGARDSVRLALTNKVSDLANSHVTVFLPQFVIN